MSRTLVCRGNEHCLQPPPTAACLSSLTLECFHLLAIATEEPQGIKKEEEATSCLFASKWNQIFVQGSKYLDNLPTNFYFTSCFAHPLAEPKCPFLHLVDLNVLCKKKQEQIIFFKKNWEQSHSFVRTEKALFFSPLQIFVFMLSFQYSKLRCT